MTDALALRHALLTRLKMRHLALLQAIDRHRALNRVAAEMRLSQPAITKALREIEDIFATTLFERTSRGLVPTAAGQAVLQYARRWLAELDGTTQALTAIGAGRASRLRLGITPQLPQLLLTAALRRLLAHAPRISVEAREGTTDQLVALLLAGEIDCGIGRIYEGESRELVQEPIYEQEPCLVVASASRARLSRGPLDWAKLSALDWILPPPNTPMRRTYNAIFVGAGVQPPLPILETTSVRSMESVLRLASNAITILPREIAAEMAQGGHCAALPYTLGWSLPPVTFFTLKALADHPAIRTTAEAAREAARGMGK